MRYVDERGYVDGLVRITLGRASEHMRAGVRDSLARLRIRSMFAQATLLLLLFGASPTEASDADMLRADHTTVITAVDQMKAAKGADPTKAVGAVLGSVQRMRQDADGLKGWSTSGDADDKPIRDAAAKLDTLLRRLERTVARIPKDKPLQQRWINRVQVQQKRVTASVQVLIGLL